MFTYGRFRLAVLVHCVEGVGSSYRDDDVDEPNLHIHFREPKIVCHYFRKCGERVLLFFYVHWIVSLVALLCVRRSRDEYHILWRLKINIAVLSLFYALQYSFHSIAKTHSLSLSLWGASPSLTLPLLSSSLVCLSLPFGLYTLCKWKSRCQLFQGVVFCNRFQPDKVTRHGGFHFIVPFTSTGIAPILLIKTKWKSTIYLTFLNFSWFSLIRN